MVARVYVETTVYYLTHTDRQNKRNKFDIYATKNQLGNGMKKVNLTELRLKEKE